MLPELLANTNGPIGVLSATVNATVTSITVSAPAPEALRGEGQFRIQVGSELLLVHGPVGNSTTWTVERALETTSPAEHPVGTDIFHYLTAGSLDERYAKVGTDGTVGGPGGSALSGSVVSRSRDAQSAPTTSTVKDFQTIYPQEFGAYGTAEDETSEYQEIVDTITSEKLGNVQILLPPSVHLNTVPRTDRQGNATLALPEYTGATEGIMTFKGADGGTTFTSRLTGLAYSAEHGCPSVIGGPTPEQLGINAHFGSYKIVLDNVVVRVPENTTICGIDLSRIPTAYFYRVIEAAANSGTISESDWTFGIRLPEGDNAEGAVVAGLLKATRFRTGVVMNTSQVVALCMNIQQCVGALGITGNEQYGGNDGHSSSIVNLKTHECEYHLSGWTPTTGPTSTPAGHPIQVTVDLWDIEDGAGSKTPFTVEHLLDANNQFFGRANYGRVLANTGRQVNSLKVIGGENFAVTDINAAPKALENSHAGVFGDGSDGEAVLNGTNTVAWATKSGSEYTMTRNCYCGTLTIASGVTLKLAGYWPFACVGVINEGTITGAGNAGAANGTPGAAGAAGIVAGGTIGGTGGTGAGGAAGNVTGGFGIGTGGAGGKGSSGVGGAAGTVANAGVEFVYRNPNPVLVGAMNFGGTVRNFAGASGGGAGGGDGSHNGGGGGAGGALIAIFAPSIVNSGTITAAGGAGGTPTEGNCGGGGGGGGGSIYAYTLSPWTAGTTNVAGGAPGSASGTGEAGKVGGNGRVLNVILK